MAFLNAVMLKLVPCLSYKTLHVGLLQERFHSSYCYSKSELLPVLFVPIFLAQSLGIDKDYGDTLLAVFYVGLMPLQTPARTLSLASVPSEWSSWGNRSRYS